MKRNDFLIDIVATAAQNVRAASGVALIDACIQPSALLHQLENMLIAVHMAYGAHQLRCLREDLEIELLVASHTSPDDVRRSTGGSAGTTVGGYPAGLLLYDVCQALELDDATTRRALSLADWSDVMCVLEAEIAPRSARWGTHRDRDTDTDEGGACRANAEAGTTAGTTEAAQTTQSALAMRKAQEVIAMSP